MPFQVIQCDAIAGLNALAEGSISLVLSDLPSGATRAPFDKPPDLARLWPAVWRCLKPDGAAVFMASSLRFAADLIASQPKRYRYDLVWKKGRGSGHLNANRMPLRSHEYILVFYRKRGTYNPQMVETGKPLSDKMAGRASTNYDVNYQRVVPFKRSGATDRHPASVLRFAGVNNASKKRIHPQQKPQALMRWLVRTYTNPGEWVVDPYAGSGSACLAAIAEGRCALGFDLNTYP